jgi:hypothetical protein
MLITSTYSASLEHDMIDERESVIAITEKSEEEQKELQAALATIEAEQKTEKENTIAAADRALDRVVAKALIMLAVTMSSGFSVWTGTVAYADSNQLGSLALLASLTVGVGAMFTSALALNAMNSSFRVLLQLKEIKINGHAVEYYQKRVSRTKAIGFTHGSIQAREVRLSDILAVKAIWGVFCLLLFGPAYALLPTAADASRQSANTQFELHVTVRGHPVVLTTEGTDRHSKDAEGVNYETINVCYRHQPATAAGNSPVNNEIHDEDLQHPNLRSGSEDETEP